MVIRFHFNNKVLLKNRKKLKHFLKEIFSNENISTSSLDIVFCDDEYLLNINRRFLKHDYYTDIISFNLNPNLNPVEGELYISVDRVRENSSVFSCSLEFELHRVIIHGVLHFCGFLDNSKKDQLRMREKENFYLNQYFVSRETK